MQGLAATFTQRLAVHQGLGVGSQWAAHVILPPNTAGGASDLHVTSWPASDRQRELPSPSGPTKGVREGRLDALR